MKKIIPALLIITVYLLLSFTTAQAQAANQSMPKVKVTLAGKESGLITKEEFLSDSMLRVNDTSFYEIVSFKITIFQKSSNPVIDVPGRDGKIPEKARNIIKDAHAGTKIIIEYLRASSASGADQKIRTLEPLVFTITDK